MDNTHHKSHNLLSADLGGDAREPAVGDALARPARPSPDPEPRAPRHPPRGRRDLRDDRGGAQKSFIIINN